MSERAHARSRVSETEAVPAALQGGKQEPVHALLLSEALLSISYFDLD